jgi:hypothetical protein
MSYPPGTKVICIDATPIPIYCASAWEPDDFSFPNGFLQEGTTYCVARAIQNPDRSFGLHLAGLPMFFRGREGNWHHLRFRKVVSARNTAESNCQKKRSANISLLKNISPNHENDHQMIVTKER